MEPSIKENRGLSGRYHAILNQASELLCLASLLLYMD